MKTLFSDILTDNYDQNKKRQYVLVQEFLQIIDTNL